MSEVYDIAGISSLDSINQDIVSRNNSIRNTNDMNRRQYIKDIGDLRGKVNSADPKIQKVKDKAESLADAGYSAYTGVKVGKGVGATKIGDAISSFATAKISDGIQQGLNTFKSGSARATRRAEFLNKGDLQEGFELSEIPNRQYATIAERASARPLQGAIAPPQASTARFVGRRQGNFDLFDDEAEGAERLNLRPTSQAIDRFLGTSTAQTPAGYGAAAVINARRSVVSSPGYRSARCAQFRWARRKSNYNFVHNCAGRANNPNRVQLDPQRPDEFSSVNRSPKSGGAKCCRKFYRAFGAE